MSAETCLFSNGKILLLDFEKTGQCLMLKLVVLLNNSMSIIMTILFAMYKMKLWKSRYASVQCFSMNVVTAHSSYAPQSFCFLCFSMNFNVMEAVNIQPYL